MIGDFKDDLTVNLKLLTRVDATIHPIRHPAITLICCVIDPEVSHILKVLNLKRKNLVRLPCLKPQVSKISFIKDKSGIIKPGRRWEDRTFLKALSAIPSAVMQSDGYKQLEESWPSLLSELLETIALVDDKPNSISGKKRSGSSIFGLDLAGDGGAAESVNPHIRRVRRRKFLASECTQVKVYLVLVIPSSLETKVKVVDDASIMPSQLKDEKICLLNIMQDVKEETDY
ncbi:OLC1v1026547C1 [Oldenlandia corymbosa var. corymbosa]|uniref:OLC1v1026547C1 n=1 Tax=Oldenlandia corymbosa var. corymbosa TaxID=529605 RepID=A0AAV1C7B5_OLDCO|nr:OLC1v1026547C1 [Oldenlandia corymbosa var. corymbosa]